jgi:formate dehydrogenase (coenzyme F420) beta subunit
MNNLKEIAVELINSKKVDLIIGYKPESEKRTKPIFITSADDASSLVFNIYSLNNLAVYLTKKEIKDKGKIGIVAKGCDIKAIIQLINENQIARDKVYIIAANCGGVVKDFGLDMNDENIANKCKACLVNNPELFDVLINEPVEKNIPENRIKIEIDKIDSMTPEEKFKFWNEEFSKCIRCYACRQVCPLCYCEQCIADRSVPDWIESSPTERANFSWNLIRAFHQSGRCIGCNECERACPVNIPLSLLNAKMAITAMNEFGYFSGKSIDEPTLVGTYSNQDREDFIK